MAIETDLSRKPYFDDYDPEKNFYQVLYRPATSVQARELNQMQSIMQDQINKFGRHIFKEGSVVEGCSFTFDNDYDFVKIRDNYANNFAIDNIVDINEKIVRNANGLEAIVINTVGGFQSQDPDLNTLYIKYLNATNFPNGAIQSVFQQNEELAVIIPQANLNVSNVVVASVSNATGKGYAFTTSEGVIFKKGFFVRIEPQTILVDKYNNLPNNLSVGFDVEEDIVTPEIDTSLLDNAAGAPNFKAPGAHRLKLNGILIVKQTNTIDTSSFFSLCDFQNGLPISIKNDPQYAALGREQARRTFETNGDYVVNPFFLNARENTSNNQLLNLVVSPGIGYVKGTRIEFINNLTVPLRKGLDFETIDNQNITANFGYFFRVNQYCGDFNNNQVAKVELHNNARTAITSRDFLGVSYSAANKIGTAYVRGVAYDSGTPGADATYILYLFNIRMDPGFGVGDARSIILNDSGVKAVADIILTFDAATSSNTARIQDASNELMVYPFGQRAIKPDGFSAQEFIYRNKSTANFTTSGNASVTITTTVPGGTDSIVPTGNYSSANKRQFIIVPIANGFSSNLAGGISGFSTNTLISGNASTTFLSNFIPGDYIFANNTTRRVINIVNNTTMFVDAAFTTNTSAGIVYQKAYPAGVPINLESSTRTIVANSSSAQIFLGETVNSAFSTAFYYNVNRETSVPIQKNISRNTLVKINVANNAGGVTGPWCLGIPDVLRINRVYVGSNNSYSNTNPDLVSAFTLDNGQRDAHYDLAYISSNRLLSNNASILVDLDHFTTDTSQGVGFFTAASYPVDDANTANTSAIQTYQIPTYTSKSIKSFIDLRDAVDFRPFAVNTAIITANVAAASINPANTLTIFSYGADGSYLPTPDTAYEASVQYFLPRKDRISLSTSGEVVITEGVSDLRPFLPATPAGMMTIGDVEVSPYPSLDVTTAKLNDRYDYAVQVNSQQTRRFTMADIRSLAKRIDNLEYYTSLSLLEQAATNLLVRSGLTGENRFKNGFLVDPFRDHTIGNTLHPLYNIAVDSNRNELRPVFGVIRFPMVFDSAASNNVVKTGELITLAYSNTTVSVQQFASTTEALTAGNFFGYRGSVLLSPAGETSPDLKTNPEVVNNVDLFSNWINLERGWNTQWGAWTDTNLAIGPTSLTNSNLNSQLAQSIDKQTQEVSRQLTTQPSDTSIYVGDFVSNVSLNPFIRSQYIFFRASGLKPFARLYPFFADANVSAVCIPLRPYDGNVVIQNGVQFSTNNLPLARDQNGNVYERAFNNTTFNSPLIADANGNLFGAFYVPANTFRSGELEFKLLDTPVLTVTGVSTQASAIFFGTSLSIQRQRVDLQIRPVVNITQEITNISNIQQTNITNITQEVTNVTQVNQNTTGRDIQYSSAPDPYWYGEDMGPSGAGPGNGDTSDGGTPGTGDGGGGAGGDGKIACTAMNERYGFGSFRQAIWLEYSRKHMTKEHEIGYHFIGMPLIDIAYKQNKWYSKPARVALEHLARYRTADLRAEMRGGNRVLLGRIYRSVLEPLCYMVGKFLGSKNKT